MYLPEPKEYEICPAGTFFARCWQIVDMGTQKTEYQGVPSLKRLVQIGWEIPTELMQDGRPFSVFRSYTWSMSEKANFRKDLESWRGKKFVDEDFNPQSPKRFDIRKLLGVGATLSIIHTESKDGTRTYANIKSVSGLPKGGESVLLPAVNKPVYLSMFGKGNWDQEVYEALPEWLRDKIAASPEYQTLVLGKAKPAPQQATFHEDLDDEVPF